MLLKITFAFFSSNNQPIMTEYLCWWEETGPSSERKCKVQTGPRTQTHGFIVKVFFHFIMIGHQFFSF